jgi:hemerythrin-like domain-containing protein
MKAIRIIRDEHRSLAAVIHGLLYLVREIRERGAAPDFPLFMAMLRYIDEFPERFHHPKEDAYLFARLAARRPEAAPLLDRLHAEHQVGARKMRELVDLLDRYRREGPPAFAAFASAIDAYATFHWEHMRAEETEVLPLCEAYLTTEDWAAIDAAFTGHSDPLLDVEVKEEFAALFRRIVQLAPAPIGVGPPLS